MYRKGELLPNQLCQFACPDRLARNKLLLDELQRLALQLMGSVWTALSGYQSGEAALVEDGLGLQSWNSIADDWVAPADLNDYRNSTPLDISDAWRRPLAEDPRTGMRRRRILFESLLDATPK